MSLVRPTDQKMTIAEFLAWYEQQEPGQRYELYDGVVYPREMSAERATHARVKANVYQSLKRTVGDAGLPCEAFMDGMAVSVDAGNSYEPDALVRCGPRLPGEATIVEDPVIVVEVASPSTYRVDALAKLVRYFTNVHVVHYLIVLPAERTVLHHRRGEPIQSTIHREGSVTLDPPGLTLVVADLFADL